ncbi:MAG: cell division protein FtsA [Candidatus Coatesbacteria bacterium]|nr:MAG: cell division protein FtsA [Candidatus Coatesbacteria bacterium]
MAEKAKITTGLDIGTTKVCCVTARTNGGVPEILGSGIAPSLGVKRGVVNDIGATVAAITEAVSEAELMAGVEVEAANVGIAGGHIKSMNSRGLVAVARTDHEITERDIERAIEQAKALALPVDREVLHVLPKEFTVDDQHGVRDPRGMIGTRLEADVHIITGAVMAAQNLLKAVHKARLKVNQIILEPLASARAVLTDDEMELGVALVDMGGGTTDIAVYQDGAVRHTAVLAVGGNNVTQDLAIGLRTPKQEAEHVKREYAVALAELVEDDDLVEVEDVGGRKSRLINRRKITEIVQPRMEEIINLVKLQINQAVPFEMLPAGVVFTGGASKIQGLPDLAEKVLGVPSRVGYPLEVGGLADAVEDPIYSTAVGLIMYGMPGTGRFSEGPEEDSVLFKKILEQMKKWIEQII